MTEITDAQIAALRHDQSVTNSCGELQLPPASFEIATIDEYTRRNPKMLEAARAHAARTFPPPEPPAPRMSLEAMTAEIERLSGRVAPVAPVASAQQAEQEPVENIRDKVLRHAAQPTALPPHMESR